MYWATRAAAAAALLVVGVLIGRWLFHVEMVPVIEKPAPAIVQQDGSQVLARAARDESAKPAHQLPKGATLERTVQVKAKPKAPPRPTTDGKLESAPVTVDLSLVKMPDETRRVVASSPDGEILGVIDVPVAAFSIPETKKWAAGLYVNPVYPQERGLFIDRDIGRLRIGAELGQNARNDLEARVKVGITF